MFALQPAQPFVPVIVKVVEAPTKEISVADVLLGSVGITGLFLLGAAVLGFALGGALILFKRWQAAREVGEQDSEVFRLTQTAAPAGVIGHGRRPRRLAAPVQFGSVASHTSEPRRAPRERVG